MSECVCVWGGGGVGGETLEANIPNSVHDSRIYLQKQDYALAYRLYLFFFTPTVIFFALSSFNGQGYNSMFCK